MKNKWLFDASDAALTGTFCGVWAVLNLTLGPLSFALFRLPILHDFAAFFTLLLAVWFTRKAGVASLVGVIGSALALAFGMPVVVLGFAVGAVLFDLLMVFNLHEIKKSMLSIVVTVGATLVSAFFAGVVIGAIILNQPFSLSVILGFWHLIGGILTLAATFPVIGLLEKSHARAIRIG